MTVRELMQSLEGDCMGRLKWLVIRETGISPVSLGAALLSRRKTVELACHIALDRREKGRGREEKTNPEFDMDRFRALEGGGR